MYGINFMLKNQKGVAAVIAFSVLFILLALGSIFLFTMDIEFKIGTNQRASTQALYIAEAGIQYGLDCLSDNPNWRTNGVPIVHQLGRGQYSLEADDAAEAGFVLLTSTGEVALPAQGVVARRIVQVKASSRAVVRYVLQSNSDITSGTGTVTGYVYTTDSEGVYAKGIIDIDDSPNTVQILVSPQNPVPGPQTENGTEDIPMINMPFYEARADIIIDAWTDGNGDGIASFPREFRPRNNRSYYIIGDVVIDTGTREIVWQKTSIVATGTITIKGTERLFMRRDKDREAQEWVYYPILAANGSIIESGSGSDETLRDLDGLIISDGGNIEFESILLSGAIIGQKIILKNKVDITYDLKYIAKMSGGLIGTLREEDWQEIY